MITVENVILTFLQGEPCSDREPQASPYLLVSCVVEVVKPEALVVPGESQEKGEGGAALLSGKNESDVILSGAPKATRRASEGVKANNRGEKRRALLCMKGRAPALSSGAPFAGEPSLVLLLCLLHPDSKREGPNTPGKAVYWMFTEGFRVLRPTMILKMNTGWPK